MSKSSVPRSSTTARTDALVVAWIAPRSWQRCCRPAAPSTLHRQNWKIRVSEAIDGNSSNMASDRRRGGRPGRRCRLRPRRAQRRSSEGRAALGRYGARGLHRHGGADQPGACASERNRNGPAGDAHGYAAASSSRLGRGTSCSWWRENAGLLWRPVLQVGHRSRSEQSSEAPPSLTTTWSFSNAMLALTVDGEQSVDSPLELPCTGAADEAAAYPWAAAVAVQTRSRLPSSQAGRGRHRGVERGRPRYRA